MVWRDGLTKTDRIDAVNKERQPLQAPRRQDQWKCKTRKEHGQRHGEAEESEEQERDDDRRASPKPGSHRSRHDTSDERTNATGGEHQTDRLRTQSQIPRHVQDIDSKKHVAAEIDYSGGERKRA